MLTGRSVSLRSAISTALDRFTSCIDLVIRYRTLLLSSPDTALLCWLDNWDELASALVVERRKLGLPVDTKLIEQLLTNTLSMVGVFKSQPQAERDANPLYKSRWWSLGNLYAAVEPLPPMPRDNAIQYV
jgi:hypothetical protein